MTLLDDICDIMQYHITLCHMISHQIILYHITLYTPSPSSPLTTHPSPPTTYPSPPPTTHHPSPLPYHHPPPTPHYPSLIRSIESDMNVFQGLVSNPIFVGILLFTVVAQYGLVEFGGAFVRTVRAHTYTYRHIHIRAHAHIY